MTTIALDIAKGLNPSLVTQILEPIVQNKKRFQAFVEMYSEDPDRTKFTQENQKAYEKAQENFENGK